MKKNLYTILFMLLATSGIKGMHDVVPVEGSRPNFNTSARSRSSSIEARTAEIVASNASKGINVGETNSQALTVYNPEFAEKQPEFANYNLKIAKQEQADNLKKAQDSQRTTMSGRLAEATGYQSAIHPEGWTFTGVGQAAARPFVATGEAIYKAPGTASYIIGGKGYEKPMTSTATAAYEGGKAAGQAIGSGLSAVGSGAKNLASKAYNAFDITAQEKQLTPKDAKSEIETLNNLANGKAIKSVKNGDGTTTYTKIDGLYRVNETTGEVFFTPRTWTGTPARNIKYYLNQLPSLKTVKSKQKFTEQSSNELLKNNNINPDSLTSEQTQELIAIKDNASKELKQNMTETQFNSWWNNLFNGIRNLFSRKSSSNNYKNYKEEPYFDSYDSINSNLEDYNW
ncbi:MAG: hypothetical protein ACXWL2_01660 [Candidatus Chromulinivorax sp.]